MTPVSFVDDPAIDRQLGDDLALTDTTHTAAVWLPYTNGSTE